MRVFGPRYPAKLQKAVNHAEQLCAVLSRFEASEATRDDAARGWLMGRSEEIEKIASCIVGDWALRARTVDDAARALAGYLSDLHVSAHDHFGLELVLECCFSDSVATAPLARQDTVTRIIVAPRVEVRDTIAESFAGLAPTWRRT